MGPYQHCSELKVSLASNESNCSPIFSRFLIVIALVTAGLLRLERLETVCVHWPMLGGFRRSGLLEEDRNDWLADVANFCFDGHRHGNSFRPALLLLRVPNGHLANRDALDPSQDLRQELEQV